MQPTQNTYALPLGANVKIRKVVTDSPGHPGPYAGAIDFAVDIGAGVLAPLEGKVITVVDGYDKYGSDPKYSKLVNYVQIAHKHGEVSDLMHLAKDSVLVKEGDIVKPGKKSPRRVYRVI